MLNSVKHVGATKKSRIIGEVASGGVASGGVASGRTTVYMYIKIVYLYIIMCLKRDNSSCWEILFISSHCSHLSIVFY